MHLGTLLPSHSYGYLTPLWRKSLRFELCAGVTKHHADTSSSVQVSPALAPFPGSCDFKGYYLLVPIPMGMKSKVTFSNCVFSSCSSPDGELLSREEMQFSEVLMKSSFKPYTHCETFPRI